MRSGQTAEFYFSNWIKDKFFCNIIIYLIIRSKSDMKIILEIYWKQRVVVDHFNLIEYLNSNFANSLASSSSFLFWKNLDRQKKTPIKLVLRLWIFNKYQLLHRETNHNYLLNQFIGWTYTININVIFNVNY